MSTLSDRVRESLRRLGLLDQPGVLAVSGGPDSMGLAAAAVDLARSEHMVRPTVAHFNHQLRGDESDADEAFVEAFAESRSLAFRSGRLDVAAFAQQTGRNLEEAARDARYAWLVSVARDLGATWIATGHSADDQAETILHHLLRGSGLRGLGGMPELRPLAEGVCLVRPLLQVRRAAIAGFLETQGVTARRDATNDDCRRTRSRLRHATLPALAAEYNPALVDVLVGLGEQCREAAEAIEAVAAQLLAAAELPRAGPLHVLRAAPLAEANRTVACEAFRLLWRREGWPAGGMRFDDWRSLAALAEQPSGAHDYPGPIRVRRIGGVLQIEPRLDPPRS